MTTQEHEFDIAALEKEEDLNAPVASATREPELDAEADASSAPPTSPAPSDAPADESVDKTTDEQFEGVDETDAEEVVDPCVKCGVGKDPDYPMCRSCGYYETLDTYVDVDSDDPDLMPGMQQSKFKVPTWVYVVPGVQILLIAESLFVTFNLSSGNPIRMIWSIVQLALGFTTALVAQGRATFLSVMEDADSDMGDFVMKPFKVWGVIVSKLPDTSVWLGAVLSGVMAMILSLAVIQSIPFHKLFETDAPPPKAPNLAKAIAEQAKEAEDPDMTMEEGLNEFAGQVPEEEDEDLLRKHEQGVIIGYYLPRGKKQISSVIVATAVKKKLEILGTISAGMDDETKAKLAEDLRKYRRDTPFVDSTLNANWVQPVYLCEVSYKLNRREIPTDIRFERLLGKAKVPSGAKSKPKPQRTGPLGRR